MAEHPESNISVEQLVSVLTKAVTVDGLARSTLFDLPAEKVTALERDVLRILVVIRSAMNQTAPINRLPPEILTKVLECREGDKDLIFATHVCQRWRSTLTSTPSLWTEVVFRNSNRLLTYLTRSGALPIDASFMPTHASTRRSHLEEFFTSPIPWIDRVRSLNIEGDEQQIRAVIRQLCLPAPPPLLQSLKLNGRQHQTPTWRPLGTVRFSRGFLGGQALSLRNLSFNSISPRTPIINLPLSNLTSFTWIDENSKVAAKDLLALLVSAPLLELMTIHLRVRSLSTVEQRTVVTLNRLRRLTWFNPGGLFSLTSCLITPELQWLSLHLTPAPESPHIGLASILPPNEGHFPLLIEPTELRYTIRGGTRLCQFHSTMGHVDITVTTPPGYHDDSIPFWSLRNASISLRQIKEMTVEVGDHSLGGIPIEQFENLETLELIGGSNLLRSLTLPHCAMPSGVPVVPFPALLELQINFDSYTSSDILMSWSVLMARKRAGHRVGTLRIRGKCKKFVDESIAKIGVSVDELVLELTHGASCTGHHPLL